MWKARLHRQGSGKPLKASKHDVMTRLHFRSSNLVTEKEMAWGALRLEARNANAFERVNVLFDVGRATGVEGSRQVWEILREEKHWDLTIDSMCEVRRCGESSLPSRILTWPKAYIVGPFFTKGSHVKEACWPGEWRALFGKHPVWSFCKIPIWRGGVSSWKHVA